VVNMLEEGVEVAIRIGNLPDSTYRAMQVGSVRRVLCAAADYLDTHGIPQTPDDLLKHHIILARGLNPNDELRFLRNGLPQTVKLQPIFSVSDNDSAARAAMAGLGITHLLSYQVAEPVHSGKLKIVLSEFESPAIPVHILHREGRHSSAKVRSFVDLMAERLRKQLSA